MAVAMAMGMPTSSCSVMVSPVLTSFCLPNSQNVSSLPFPRARVRVHTLSLSFSTMAKTTSPDPRRKRIIVRPQTPTQTPTKSNPLPVGLTRNLTTFYAVSTATPTPTTTPTEARAVGRYIPMSAHKARRVIDQIRGRSYADVLMILELMPYRACYPILKLVYSAAANAKHNMGLNEGSLIVSKAEVNEGNTVKKLKPQARGRGFPIRRYSCHITVVLKDVDLEEKY